MKKFKSIMWWCIAGLFAIIGQKCLFNLFDFNYDVFNDSFDITKFLIDFGVFMALFFFAYVAIDRLRK